jgi:type II secretory pathway pseudopilin PulG
MAPDRASLMPTSLDALTTLDLTLIAAIAILSLVSGGLALRLQGDREKAQVELKEVQEEAEQTLLQLHQLQEELKQIGLADQSKQEQIKTLDYKLKAAQTEAKAAKEEAELTLLQLHQVQEELEYYFLNSRAKSDMLQQHNQQANDVIKLIKDLTISSNQ